mmetsp:Transcript_5856/g.23004  ORF Transcript_5856/g.23004 Transcript_5856/m.23004 type:complete len:376 (+) Transcript_5856:1309-2436(+)
MEDHGLVLVGGQAADRIALAGRQRVTLGREHDAQRDAAVPLRLDLVQRAVGRVHQQLEEVALEPHHDGLGLGVAHAGVELDGARLAVLIDHQPGVQEAGEGMPVAGHAGDGRLDDLVHDLGMHIGRDDGRRRIGAHAAGVGAFVAVQQALVVLAGGQRDDVLTVAHDDEAGLLAGEEVLDDDARAAGVVGHAELVVFEDPRDRLVGLIQGHRDDDALASRQAVGLDDDGRTAAVDVGMGRCRVGEGLVGRGRDAVALHEVLGEGLGAFELGGGLGRAEDAQAACAELVDHARRQRRFRADHGQRDLVLGGKIGQRLDVRRRDGHVAQPLIPRGAAVAWRDEDLADPLALCQLPGQGMFTAAVADDEDSHQFNSAL